MADYYNSSLTGSQIEQILVGIRGVVGLIKRNQNGTFESISLGETGLGDRVDIVANYMVTLENRKTTVITGAPSQVEVTLPEPETGIDYICGLIFKAGTEFSFTVTPPTGYTVEWQEYPSWVSGKIYEIFFRCLWVDNTIIAKFTGV